MKPIDPRLLRYTRSTRRFVLASVAIGSCSALALIVQAGAVADIIATAVDGELATHSVIALVFAIAARSVLAWLSELVAVRSASSAKGELRNAVLVRLSQLPPNVVNTGEIAVVLGRGIDALDAFFSKYFSQLVLAGVVPLLILSRMVLADWQAGVTVAITLPLIPVFMALVGWLTEAKMQMQLQRLGALGGHFLDLMRGMQTLRIFNKAQIQERAIQDVSESLRSLTMANLRIAFVSSLVLELIATMGVALVAVSVGFRLVNSSIAFEDALVVLLLAPEVYLPLRAVGTQYHANAEGVAAADEMFKVIETQLPQQPSTFDVDGKDELQTIFPLCFRNISLTYKGRTAAAVDNVNFVINSGDAVALTGESGSGKSTVLSLLAGLQQPSSGVVTISGRPLHSLDLFWWRDQISWTPQRPQLFAMSIDENIRIARPTATDAEIVDAVERSGVAEFLSDLPRGLDTVLGERGYGLSSGQRQRIGIARAFLRDTPLVLMDEPTENLDFVQEQHVIAALKELARNRTVVFVAHSDVLRDLASKTIDLSVTDCIPRGEVDGMGVVR